MVERKAGSQIDNLTSDHKKLGIDPTPVCANKVRHTVGNDLEESYKIASDLIPIRGLSREL